MTGTKRDAVTLSDAILSYPGFSLFSMWEQEKASLSVTFSSCQGQDANSRNALCTVTLTPEVTLSRVAVR